MSTILSIGKKQVIYLAVLLGFIILLNLFSTGLIQSNTIYTILLICLLVWVSLGLAFIARWLWQTFKPVEKI